MAIIEVKNLSKDFKVKLKSKGFKGSLKSIIKPSYKTVKAVKNISFEVDKGEINPRVFNALVGFVNSKTAVPNVVKGTAAVA